MGITGTDRLRVLQVVTSTHRRGAELFALELEGALDELGVEVRTVALVGHAGADPIQAEVLGPSRWSRQTLSALRQATRQADVVIAHGSATLAACALTATGTGIPFIYRLIGDPRHWTASPLRRIRVGVLLHRAAAIATYFPEAAAVIRARYHLRSDRVVAIPKGVRIATFLPQTDDDQRRARVSLGLPADTTIIGSVCALSTEKRPGLAIEAIAELDDVHLVLAGDGPLRNELAALAAPLTDRVHFVGVVKDPRLVYAACDAILLTSETEGVPGVLIEAALSARPVVTTDVGGVRNVVVDGVTGVISTGADPTSISDSLRLVLAERDTMGAAAREHGSANFDIAPVAAKWLDLITRLAQTPGRS